MNDEQQLWRDVQKFMNQFPGFVAIAKKIGEVGDLAQWQEVENRKLELLKQEVEKQRKIIASERDAANVEIARKRGDMEDHLRARTEQLNADEAAARAGFEAITASARVESDRMIGEAKAEAKKVTDAIERRKKDSKALETEIAALMDQMLAAKNEHEGVSKVLEKAKADHARFISRIVGTAGG